MFSAIFSKAHSFCDFLIAYMDLETSKKGPNYEEARVDSH